MRIVSIIKDCVDSITSVNQFINEPRSISNILVDNGESPFIILNRPIDMPFVYRGNLVSEIYNVLLIYGTISDNTQFEQSQDNHDIEVKEMLDLAKIMVLNLSKHSEVKSVELISPMKDFINGFDVNASGIFQYLKITLLPPQPDVCATLL